MRRLLLHRRKKSSNSNSHARRPNSHSSQTSKNGISFNVASPSSKPPSQKPISYARAWRNSNRPKDGSIGWKYNSPIKTPSIEPHYTKSTANWPNGTGASVELESLSQRLQEQEEALAQWETKYAHTLTQHEAQIAKLQQQLAAQDQLQTQLLHDKQLLNERDERIDGLKHRIQELEGQQQGLTVQVKTVGEKQEEIDRLRKRLVEVRAALRIKADGGQWLLARKLVRMEAN